MLFKMNLPVLVLAVCALTACSRQEVKSIEYYSQNMEETINVINICGPSSDEAVIQNCGNARRGWQLNRDRITDKFYEDLAAKQKKEGR